MKLWKGVFVIWLAGFLVMEVIFHLADLRVRARWRFDDEANLTAVCATWPVTAAGYNWPLIRADLSREEKGV